MGHLLGLGCTVNFHVDLGVFVSWGHWLTRSDPRSDQAGKACGIGFSRRCEFTDHQIFGRVVEYIASASKPETHRETSDASLNVDPLLVNIVGYYIAAAYLILGSMRAIVLERERRSAWVRNWSVVLEFQFASLAAFCEMAPRCVCVAHLWTRLYPRWIDAG